MAFALLRYAGCLIILSPYTYFTSHHSYFIPCGILSSNLFLKPLALVAIILSKGWCGFGSLVNH